MNQGTLKIILSKKGPSSEGAGEKRPKLGENVTAACPSHLIISDLPVAKGIGSAPAASRVKEVKHTINSKPRVHFCMKCDYPIAIYGRLSPCDHAFCLECARSNYKCYICEAEIEKIEPINKVKGGIFICGLSSCLKSFREKNALGIHFLEVHGVASSICFNDDDGNLHLQPINGPLPRPTAQPNP